MVLVLLKSKPVFSKTWFLECKIRLQNTTAACKTFSGGLFKLSSESFSILTSPCKYGTLYWLIVLMSSTVQDQTGGTEAPFLQTHIRFQGSVSYLFCSEVQ